MHAANLNSTLYIFVAKENTPFDWTLRAWKASRQNGLSSRRFPRILSVCILSIALFLDCFHLLSKTFSRPFPYCFSCISIHIRLWRNLVRQAFQSHLLEQVPINMFSWGSCFGASLGSHPPGRTSKVRWLKRFNVSQNKRIDGSTGVQSSRQSASVSVTNIY